MSKLLINRSLRTAMLRRGTETLFASEIPQYSMVPFRTKYYHNRHRDPKYRLERTRKVWRVALPDFDEDLRDKSREKLDVDEIRSKMKEKGIAPPNVWEEKELYNPCTLTTIDPYVPPEGDGKSSKLSFRAGLDKGKEVVSNRRALSAIRNYEGEDFDLDDFVTKVTDIYVKAHEALARKDEPTIFDYVTEHCFPLMISGMNNHTISWKYLGEVEPPKVVRTRADDLGAKGNKFAQITVRMYTKQILAVYDRHGRLILGSPTQVKEVLEYIVFEKYLANEYGLWRMHDRIRPESDEESRVISKTYRCSQ